MSFTYILVVNDTRLPHVAPVFPTNPVEKDNIHEHKLKLLKMGQDVKIIRLTRFRGK